jgi:hypothetical protein
MPDTDPPTSPAPQSDAQLRETLDLLAELVASVSDRVDDQTKALDRMSKTAAEARQAAFAAKAQTDPKAYGDLVGQAVAGRIAEPLDDIERLSNALRQTALQVDRTLQKASAGQDQRLYAIHEREQKVDRFWDRTRWVAIGLPIFVAVLLMIVPRFVALHPIGCTILGGNWTLSTTYRACSFYGP